MLRDAMEDPEGEASLEEELVENDLSTLDCSPAGKWLKFGVPSERLLGRLTGVVRLL
jgi:hypothetical protein